MQRLREKVVVITGGSSGIGKAAAMLFADEGAQVIITGRHQQALCQAVAQIGRGAIGIPGDVADLAHHRTLADDMRQRFGALDVYMANAGTIHLAPSQDVTPEDFDAQFAINTRGTFFGVQSIIPVMRDGGSIILTSSLAATKALENHAVYAGSKAAIEAFSRYWAVELRARKIRVNVLSPGPVDTSILAKLGVSAADRPDFLQTMAKMIPAGRLGEADELAQAALFLASAASSFVNGTTLHVDGGMSLS